MLLSFLADWCDSTSPSSESDAGEDGSNSESEWTDTEEEPVDFSFTGNAGIKINISQNSTPVQVFQEFFDDSIIQIVVDETNIRGEESFLEKPAVRRSQRVKEWKPITIEEMKTLIGLCCLMGIVKLPDLKKILE